jgi:electron transfer flavoprotein beta subunit
VNGVKNLVVGDGAVVAKREFRGGDELYELALPIVLGVKEGINLPRYPSLPGRVRAKKMAIEETQLEWHPSPVKLERLRVPSEPRERAEILGTGVDAVGALLDLFEQWGVVA